MENKKTGLTLAQKTMMAGWDKDIAAARAQVTKPTGDEIVQIAADEEIGLNCRVENDTYDNDGVWESDY